MEAKLWRGELSTDRSAIAHFIVTKTCRRQIMSEYLDGPELAVSCEDLPDCVRCDGCGDGGVEVQDTNRTNSKNWERVSTILDSLVGNYPLC